ncbi:dihydropyrimidinase-related protein 2-like isoform X2 [Ornithodoros turicata]|uniref:dihydropyrimidinase-related protein 2-like isoform X2 n=1 Tax=Ornithodoros turicata TaxID=34597 RepID=UPI0031388BE6
MSSSSIRFSRRTPSTPSTDSATTTSAQTRILIKGGKIVNDDAIVDGDVYVEDGIIKQVGRDLIIPGGTRTIEAKGKLVLPGGIDCCTHFQLPLPSGTKSADDFYTGTRAAVAGGTTTVIDCVIDPNCSPLEAFEKWKCWADERVCCDYALQVAVTSFNAKTKEELETLVKDKGVNTFRAYMSFKDHLMLKDDELVKLLEVSKHLGAITNVHAENGCLIEEKQKQTLALGITGPEGVVYSQPEESEAEATLRAIVLANQIATPLVVSPVMSKGAAEFIVQKRNNGCVVFGAPSAAALGTNGSHYFNKCWSHAAGHVTSPPLSMDLSTSSHLLDMLGSGALHLTGSHHCTYTTAQKALGCNDFTKIPHGVNGVEERMGVVWEKGVMTGKMDACKFVAVTSTNAAKVFNLYPKKGRIQVGSDADIVVWDPKRNRTFSSKNHCSTVTFNVFEGLEVRGGPLYVLSHGHVVMDDGELHVSQGGGHFVSMPPFSPYAFSALFERQRATQPLPVNRDSYEGPAGGQVYNGGDAPSPQTKAAGYITPTNTPSQFHSRGPTRSGGRNLQDSSFSLSGAQVDDDQGLRSGIRCNNPPGGRSTGIW